VIISSSYAHPSNWRNGFIGRFAVAALKQQGHALAVFNRGTTAVPTWR